MILYNRILTGFVVILFFSLQRYESFGQNESLDKILNKLSENTNELNGYQIVAKANQVLFNGKKRLIRYISENKNLNQNSVEGLKAIADSISDSETNLFTYIYKFSAAVTSVTVQQHNGLGRLTISSETILTSNEVWENNVTFNVATNNKSQTGGWAKIRKREVNGLYGIPIYLSYTTIYDRIINSTVRSCENGMASTGQNCYVVDVSGDPNTAFKKFKIFFETNTLSPVELDSYLANGDLATQSQLQFIESKNFPHLCNRAVTRMGNTMQSVWILESAENTNNCDQLLVDKLIQAGTRVIDQRFSNTNIFYHMGDRPPNASENTAMLTNKLGVPHYEAATLHSQLQDVSISNIKRNLIRSILITLIACPLLVVLVKILRRR